MKNFETQNMCGLAMIGLIAVGALMLPICVQGELLDDFNDGNDVGWTRFSIPEYLPGASWDPRTGAYRLSVEGERERAPEGSIVASFLNITDDGPEWHYSQGYWWATVVRETENSTTHLAMRGIFAPRNAYMFGWYPDAGLVIQIIAGGSGTVLANDTTFVQEVGAAYTLEAGAFGSTLELRMWPVDEPRPESPQVTATHSEYAWGANCVVAEAFSDGDLSVAFDDVCFVAEQTAVPGSSIGDPTGLVAVPNPSPGRILLRAYEASDNSTPMEMSIYDVRGTLVHSTWHSGLRSEFEWDGRTQTGQLAPSGVYFAVLRNGSRMDWATIQLIR